MASLLERKLIVVTGKGGAGKSTISAALGLLGARLGLRTLVVEVGGRSHLAALYGRAAGTDADALDEPRAPEMDIELEPGLWSLTLDPDRALIEWMRDLSGRLPARLLAGSSSFRYFAAAAPGARELVSLVKLHDLSVATTDRRYDLIVLDAPATGHALAMLASPSTFTGIVRGGPLARRAEEVREMLSDKRSSAYVAVTRATEMAVSETLELERGLRLRLERDLDAVVVNGTIARRFSAAEMERIAALAREDTRTREKGGSTPTGVATTVADAARSTCVRSHMQRRQIDRLRRLRAREGAAHAVIGVPFAFVPQLDLAELAKVAGRLERSLAPPG